MSSDSQKKGCFLVNTISEQAGSDTEITKRVMLFLSELMKLFLNYTDSKPWDYKIKKGDFLDLVMTYITGMKQQIKYNYNKESHLNSINSIFGLLE